MKPLSESAISTLTNAITTAGEPHTQALGLTRQAAGVGLTITKLDQTRTAQGIADPVAVGKVLSNSSTISFYRIGPTTTYALRNNAIELLQELLTYATYEDAAYWIGRFVQHFPSKDPSRNAIIVGDLAGDCVQECVRVCALVKALSDLRRESSSENPYLPASGEILNRAREYAKGWRESLERISGTGKGRSGEPRRRNMTQAEKQDMYGGRLWHQWSGQEQAEMEIYLKTLDPAYRGIFRRMYKIPEEIAA